MNVHSEIDTSGRIQISSDHLECVEFASEVRTRVVPFDSFFFFESESSESVSFIVLAASSCAAGTLIADCEQNECA